MVDNLPSQNRLNRHSVLYDLGSGVGKFVFGAALMYKANTNILILFSNRNRNPNSNNAPLPRRSNVPLVLKSYRLDTPWQLYPKKIVSKKASVTVRYRRGSNSWKEILNLES